MPNPAVIKAAVALLSDERTRKGIGWIVAAILSPVILLVALLCSLASGSSGHNTAVIELCFNGGAIPENMPAEYAACIRDMQDSFAAYEERTRTVEVENEDGVVEEQEETYAAAIPVDDLNEVYQNIGAVMGVPATDEQKANADSVYDLVRYGASTGAAGAAGYRPTGWRRTTTR